VCVKRIKLEPVVQRVRYRAFRVACVALRANTPRKHAAPLFIPTSKFCKVFVCVGLCYSLVGDWVPDLLRHRCSGTVYLVTSVRSYLEMVVSLAVGGGKEGVILKREPNPVGFRAWVTLKNCFSLAILLILRVRSRSSTNGRRRQAVAVRAFVEGMQRREKEGE